MNKELEEYFQYQNALRDVETEKNSKTVYEVISESAFIFLSPKEIMKLTFSSLMEHITFTINKIHKHKWVKVYRTNLVPFLGKTVIEKEAVFRICKKCNSVRYLSLLSYWDNLDEQRAIIVRNKIRSGKFIV